MTKVVWVAPWVEVNKSFGNINEPGGAYDDPPEES